MPCSRLAKVMAVPTQHHQVWLMLWLQKKNFRIFFWCLLGSKKHVSAKKIKLKFLHVPLPLNVQNYVGMGMVAKCMGAETSKLRENTTKCISERLEYKSVLWFKLSFIENGVFKNYSFFFFFHFSNSRTIRRTWTEKTPISP